MEALFSLLVSELERPRPLVPQVIRHLTDSYGIGRDEIGEFLEQRLPALDDTELDLLLSPLFTPKLPDQAIFAELLGRTSVPITAWPALINRLTERPTLGQLVDDAGAPHRFALKPVTLERYVHRLRLDGSVDEATFARIAPLSPPSDHALALAVARRAIWNTEARREILRRQLAGATARIADLVELLKLMETAEPLDTADVLARIPAWEEVLRGQIAGAGQPKVFFNEQVRYMHGGGRDQRGTETGALSPKQAELDFLGRLRQTLSA